MPTDDQEEPTPIPQIPTYEEPTHGLTGLLLGQLFAVERRLGKRIDESTDQLTGRWRDHGIEHTTLSAEIDRIATALENHLHQEEREKLIFDARVGPFKRLGLLVVREWRTVLIVGLVAADGVARVLGIGT